ncbi:hypothetical protein ABZ511_26135 [Nocardia gamkensis]
MAVVSTMRTPRRGVRVAEVAKPAITNAQNGSHAAPVRAGV